MTKFLKLICFVAITTMFISCDKEGVTADFEYSIKYTSDGAAKVNFANKSKGASSYYWDFGDGETSTQKSPSHKYYESGTYVVSLTAENKHEGYERYTAYIRIDLNGGNDDGTPYEIVLTKVTLTKYPLTDDNGVNWDFTDGGPDIYFTIEQDGYKLYESPTKDNATGASLSWIIPSIQLDVDSYFTLNFYDKDGTFDSDDYMYGIYFYPSDMTSKTYYSWSSGSKWAGSFEYEVRRY